MLSLTVLFEDPFWVGVVERYEGGMLTAAKITFGAEPKDYEVYAQLNAHYSELIYSPPVEADDEIKAVNPKRLQRQITKRMSEKGIGTRSQQALKLQYEQGKQEHKAESRIQRQEEEDRLFRLKQEKKKEKHRGR